MGLRNWLKRLERDSLSDLESFELVDGSAFYFDATDAELYLFCWRCLEAGHPDRWPPPPRILTQVLEAKDPQAALEQVMSPAVSDLFCYDRNILITERRLVPVSVVEGEDPFEQVLDDLSSSPESDENRF